MSGAIPPLPQYAFIAWYSAKKHGDFTFTFTYAMKTYGRVEV
jgi:hypothetical protein